MDHLCYERKDSPEKGRHLVATHYIHKGDVIFFERPLLSLQSLGNAHQGALVCRCCRCFVGGPDLALKVASRNVKREDVWGFYDKFEEDLTNGNDNYKMVQCRNKCGELYCSSECEDNMWNCCGHDLLCTGLIPEPDEDQVDEDHGNLLHPLLQFKVHACQNNEIFIMVADLVASAVSLHRKNIANQRTHADTKQSTLSVLDKFMEPYLDFTLEPWWKVATGPILDDPMKMAECVSLNKTIRELCEISSELLKKGILSLEGRDDLFHQSLLQAVQDCDERFGMFSEKFFGKIIGSFEQNAMGIRARHPLCRDILEDRELRIRRHEEIVKCIELAGMIGDCCDEDGDEDDETDSLIDNDYSPDEIDAYIASLEIDEEGKINTIKGEDELVDDEDDSPEGDDLDTLFCPLDGTSMYQTACKMNHSCDPNVIAKYVYSCSGGGTRARWGKLYPLMIQCCTVRDIQEGEELCISYIKSDAPCEERKVMLANYGFTCSCPKCVTEESGEVYDVHRSADEGFFPNNDDDIDYEKGSGYNDVNGPCGELSLTQRVQFFDQKLPSFSILPKDLYEIIIAILSEFGLRVLSKLRDQNDSKSIIVSNYLDSALRALPRRYTNEILLSSLEGEAYAYGSFECGIWPAESLREAHCVLAVMSAIGYVENGNIIAAMKLIDKGIQSGFPFNDIQLLYSLIHIHFRNCESLYCVQFRRTQISNL